MVFIDMAHNHQLKLALVLRQGFQFLLNPLASAFGSTINQNVVELARGTVSHPDRISDCRWQKL